MNRYSVNKGQHAFTPSVSMNIRRRPGRLGWFVRFSDSCRYTLPGADQKDWNKLAGLSFCLTTNHQNSAMGAWRWNPNTMVFELGHYFHVAGDRVMEEAGFVVSPGEVFAYWQEIDWSARKVYSYYQTPGEPEVEYEQAYSSFNSFLSTTREIGTWFGGNNAAPRDMTLEKELIREWSWTGPKWK